MNGFVGALWFLLFLQSVTALGRLYVRTAIVQKFGLDDVAVILTLVCFFSSYLVRSLLTAPASLNCI